MKETDMDNQKKICITEEELNEMVNEKVCERRNRVLETVFNAFWTISLVFISVFAGFAVVEDALAFVIVSFGLSIYGIAAPVLMDIFGEIKHK